MEKKRSFIKKLIPILAAVALLAGIIIPIGVNAALDLNSDAAKTVTLSDGDIPVSSVVIGTYVIHIKGLTDYVYDAAMDSANNFGQEGMYYKSELANGAWFEITDATELNDISNAEPVDKSVIEAIGFTHRTDANGVTTDLRTNEIVAPYGIPDPYDLKNMDELQPILTQYRTLSQKPSDDKTYSDKVYLKLVENLFETVVRSDYTDERDRELANLETYRLGLVNNDSSNNYKSIIESIMRCADAERRINVFETLEAALESMKEQAENSVSLDYENLIGFTPKTENEDGDEITAPLVINSEMLSAIADALSNIIESEQKYQSYLLSDVELGISHNRYTYQMQIRDAAKTNNTGAIDGAIPKVAHNLNIVDDIVADINGERDYIETELLGLVQGLYKGKVTGGASAEYRAAVAQGATEVTLKGHLESQSQTTSAFLSDYELVITAWTKRLTNDDAMAKTLELINDSEMLKGTVQADPAQGILASSVDDLIKFLQSLYAKLASNSAGNDGANNLKNEIEDLEKQRQQAIDDNELGKAKELEALLNGKQSELDELNSQAVAVLGDPNASEADKAKAKAQLSGGSAAAEINKLADKIAEGINNNETDNLANQVGLLGQMASLDPDAAKAALGMVKDCLDTAAGSGSGLISDDQLKKLGDAIDDANALADDANRRKKSPSANELLEDLDGILRDLFKNGLNDLSSDLQASALIALQKAADYYDSRELGALVSRLANEWADSNDYIFKKPNASGLTGEYAPLNKLALIGNYRYIFNNTKKMVVLQKQTEYFAFLSGSGKYETVGRQIVAMENSAVSSYDTLYICENDANSIFEKEVFYLSSCDYGVITTTDMMAAAEEIYERLIA